jgi:hypothetical protein
MCNVYAFFWFSGDLATAVAYTVIIIGAGFLQHHVHRLRVFGDLATAVAYTVVIIGAGFLQLHVQCLRDLVTLRRQLLHCCPHWRWLRLTASCASSTRFLVTLRRQWHSLFVIIGAGFCFSIKCIVYEIYLLFAILVSLRLRLAVALIGSGIQYRKLAILFIAIFDFGGMAFLQFLVIWRWCFRCSHFHAWRPRFLRLLRVFLYERRSRGRLRRTTCPSWLVPA